MIDDKIHYLSMKFHDFETFKTAATKWSLEFKQIDSGKFQGDISLLDSPQIQIGTTNLNRKLDQRGIAPAGYRTFIVPKKNYGGRYIWRGHEVLENEILIQPKSGEFSSISNPGWGIYTVSIADNLVIDFFKKFVSSTTDVLNSSAEVMKMSSQSMNRVLKQLKYIFDLAEQNTSNIKKKAFQQIFFEGIPTMILNNWFWNELKENATSSRIRDIAFRKATEYLSTCTTEMPTVQELCLISGSSERTLEYAFKEKYGFGPKEFIRKTMLNHLRQELLSSDPGFTSIQNIAHRYGLMHLGRFSSDYKKLFGELPSETLNSTL